MPRIGEVRAASRDVLDPFWQTLDGETVRLYRGHVIDVLRRLPPKSVQTIVTSPPYWGLRDYGTGQWEGGDPKCDHIAERRTTCLACGVSTNEKTEGCRHCADRWVKRKLNGTPEVVVPPVFDPNREFPETYPKGWSEGETDKDTARAKAIAKFKCGKCGARRTDHQLGSEKVPDCGQFVQVGEETKLGLTYPVYRRVNCAEHDWDNGCHVCRMVLVFREGRRVLRDDGTLWLNYGDSYASSPSGFAGTKQGAFGHNSTNQEGMQSRGRRNDKEIGIPSGNLVGIPWRVALALQADGWVLRQDIVWHKPSPMPESVTNRCTKAHEYVFLMTKKGSGYYCDMEAIKESSVDPEGYANRTKSAFGGEKAEALQDMGFVTNPKGMREPSTTRNKRSVWTVDDERAIADWLTANNPEILAEFLRQSGNKSDVWKVASAGYPGAHFATFPPKLIEPCILAGTSEKGACAKCGAPWKRVVEERKLTRERPHDYVKRCPKSVQREKIGLQSSRSNLHEPGWQKREREAMNTCSNSVAGVEVKTVGWVPTCKCGTEEVRPCLVLDPFIGSGTSCVVSLDYGRSSIGIDLSEDYLRFNAIPRIEGFMLDVPYLRDLLPVREITKRGHALGTPKPE